MTPKERAMSEPPDLRHFAANELPEVIAWLEEVSRQYRLPVASEYEARESIRYARLAVTLREAAADQARLQHFAECGEAMQQAILKAAGAWCFGNEMPPLEMLRRSIDVDLDAARGSVPSPTPTKEP